MKKVIAGLIAGLVLGTTATAGAATAYRIVYRSHGLQCAESGTGIVACNRQDGLGYTIGMSRNVVMVMKDGHKVFTRYQP